MSRDYLAKRLAAEQGIPYAEALRRTRADRRELSVEPEQCTGHDGIEAHYVDSPFGVERPGDVTP